MFTIFRGIALSAALLIGSLAHAASITQFDRTTNDGVFTLSDGQKAFLGTTSDFIGFLRPRAANGDTFNAGDTFDVSTLTNTLTGGAGLVEKFLNGTNGGLTYTGNAFDDLGTTTVGDDADYFRGVAFLFSAGGDIVFTGAVSGTSTFNAGQTRGPAGDRVPEATAPVPLPAAAWMLIAGVGGLAYAGRRRATK